MPTPDEIASEQERLYESSSLRDDLTDDSATVLLKWGESQVERVAELFPDEFEQKARFLRQLIKNINRFVGQREFNDMNGQRDYMSNVVKYLKPLNYSATEKDLFAALPDDPKDLVKNLKAILVTLSPVDNQPQSDSPEASPPTDSTYQHNIDKTEVIPDISTITGSTSSLQDDMETFSPNIDKTEVIPDISKLIEENDTNPPGEPLEKSNENDDNQWDDS